MCYSSKTKTWADNLPTTPIKTISVVKLHKKDKIVKDKYLYKYCTSIQREMHFIGVMKLATQVFVEM